jgi:hypothetical protein
VRRFAVLCAVVLTACTGGPADLAESSGSSASSPTTSSPSPTSAAFVRTCESSVFGELGPDFIDDSIVVGPIVFVSLRGYASLPERNVRARSGRARGVKVLLVVHGGEPVTLAIAPSFRRASLLYDPARFLNGSVAPIGRGDREVRFEPCGDPGPQFTQFNGAFLIDGPVCVPVLVRTGDGETLRRRLSFGAGDCR